jgi:hypothetical protein
MSIASETQLVNNALIRLGANTITDIDTDGSHESNTMQQLYAPTRDALLRQHFWNFATKRANLAADSTAPAFEWAASYPLPSDFIRLKKLFNTDGKYAIEGSSILTDQPSLLQIVYIRKITDTTAFDPLFTQTLTLMLAVLAEPRIQGGATKTGELKMELKELLLEAKIVDAQDSSPDDFIISTFQDARSGFGFGRFDISVVD